MPMIANHRTRVTGEEILDRTIMEIDIAANAVGYNELSTGLQGSLGGLPDSIGTTELKEPGVGSQNLYSSAVYSAKIANNAVGYGKLTAGCQGSLGGAADSVGTTQLKEPGVGSENIYSNAIYAAKIKNNAVGSQQLANASVGSYKLATGAVYAEKIANNTIGSQQIADGAITPKKFQYQPSIGTIADVTATGVYREYSLGMLGEGTFEYSVPPAIVLTAEGTYLAVLAHTPNLGSFKARLSIVGGGTAVVHYHAFGYIGR